VNRAERERKALDIADRCLKTQGHIALVDVFRGLGALSDTDHEAWRRRKVPYLEKVIRLNLGQINAVCRAVHASARRGKLKPSWTAYMSWGKGARVRLRFTKSGDETLERAWATHYLPITPPPRGAGNAVAEQFVHKRELAPEERRLIQKLGFHPATKRPKLWPTFQSMRAGCPIAA
jgi:hypothetical protein